MDSHREPSDPERLAPGTSAGQDQARRANQGHDQGRQAGPAGGQALPPGSGPVQGGAPPPGPFQGGAPPGPPPAGPPPGALPPGGPSAGPHFAGPGQPPPPAPPAGPPRTLTPLRVVLGLLFTLPAAGALAVSYIVPTLWTLRSGFQKVDAVSRETEAVGTANYEALAEQGYGSFTYALSFALVPLLVLLVLAPLLAYAAHRSGRSARWATRLLLAAPMVCISSAAVAGGYILDLYGGGAGDDNPLAEPSSAQSTLRMIAWSAAFGLICGLGVAVYLAALRRREAGRPVWPAMLTAGGLLALATTAVAVQTFTLPYVLTRGGPRGTTATPVLDVFTTGFSHLEFGLAAAQSSLLLGLLAVLGLLATVLIIVTGFRIEADPSSRSADEPEGLSAGRVVAWLGTILGLAGVLAVSAYGLWPWLSRQADSAENPTAIENLLANTWLPPLISAAVGIGVAALAGFGIGALRPFGRFSELLLLPFAPWLFVGAGPLMLARFVAVQEAGQVNAFAGMVPPVWVTLPALFLFTVFFRGQERHRRELVAGGAAGRGGAWAQTMPMVLPMVVLAFLATWLVRGQDLLWPTLIATDVDHYTSPMLLLVWFRQLGGSESVDLGMVLPPAILLGCFAILVLAQLFYLDRLAVRVGRR